MSEPGEKKKRISIEKLKALFSRYKAKHPPLEEADYSRYNPSEEEYLKQQADWLEKVRKRSGKKSDGEKE